MATDTSVETPDVDSKWKRALLAIGGFVVFAIVWFFTTTFMVGFVRGFAGLSQTGILQAIAAGVFVAPFAHVLFARLIDYIIEQT